ncbi:hypothetical protein ACFSKL_07350 [Belliella marina]|uniref:Uncharacterized protein n=1 Tax=Belliella marina TaxID=1644146 RepID=A0ABW4VL28_9BACT
MVITSLHGSFTVVINEENQDQILVRANNKEELMRIFDEKRISKCIDEQPEFCVQMCKQEFAHTLIMMIKEINYPDFNKMLLEIEKTTSKIFA